MSAGQAPVQRPAITLAEMNGRVEELERQRNEALTRCAALSGMNALMRQTLTEAREEIERLNGPIPSPAASAADDGSGPPTPH